MKTREFFKLRKEQKRGVSIVLYEWANFSYLKAELVDGIWLYFYELSLEEIQKKTVSLDG